MVDETVNIKLEDLGYDEFFDSKWKALELKDSLPGRVIAEHKEAYKVKCTEGEYLAKITGRQIYNATTRADFPAVGDWVAITRLDKERAVIQKILPRKTVLLKKHNDKQDEQVIASNIDAALIVESPDKDYNLNRIERYFVMLDEAGIGRTIILNKIDLATEAELDHKKEQLKNRFGGIDIILTSAITEQGLTELMNYISRGKTYCFLGSSGVGKSSLINKLLKTDAIKISEISEATGKGKHTTTSRGMYFLENGGIVIDNPGIRQVGVADTEAGIENVFDEITLLSNGCRYSDCSHIHEPGCAVMQAVKDGKLDKEMYQNFTKLKKENEFYEMSDFEKRKKDRKFGQFIKKAKDQLKDY